MERMSFFQYTRNKNIYLEGFQGNLLIGCIEWILCLLARYVFGSRVRPAFSERIVEYPLVFQHLTDDISRVLDFGCVEDLLPIHLASLGYQVTGLDFRPYPLKHKNFRFIQADILTWDPPIGEFDAVVSTSTIEHVGLGFYGDPVNPDGDKVAVHKLLTCLRPGGRLVITLPAGKAGVHRGMRIYDPDLLRRLVPNIEVKRFFIREGHHGDWRESTGDAISALTYARYSGGFFVEGMAFVVARKT